MKITIKKLPKNEIEIEGELETEVFENYYKTALKKLGENLKLDGFRKGKIPENVLISNIPEIRILEEMAEMALGEHYPKIIEKEKIDAIGRPEISIVKLARKNPLGFKIKTAVLPVIKLPDYKSSAKKIIEAVTDAEKDTTVTEKDLEDTIMDIRKSRAPKKHMKDATPEPHPDPLLNKERVPKAGEVDELPEFNDDFVRAIGPFKDVEDFKTKLKENIKLEKENLQKEKTRLKIVEKIIDESAIDLPEILVEVELDKILHRMESDITQMGLKFEDYLKHLNKKVEDLRKEFRMDAEKKAKLALILNEIAKVEKIVADEKQVEKEVSILLEQYKDADPERVRMHVENVLTNEKIFQFLEKQ
ncbi:MAG: trigger factor [Candidatus Nomurabacteria bacterium]|nr:trigger factor [Candidatus Nomurabacteria bacterium]